MNGKTLNAIKLQARILPDVEYRNPYFYFKFTGSADPEIEKFIEQVEAQEIKIKELREDIGEELFNKLSREDKNWIMETEGSIKLGRPYAQKDFERISKYLRDYES